MEILLPTVGALGAGFVGSAYFIHKYRYSDRKVNCWFCNEVTVVPVGNINCWDCPHCEQYNGFNQDGNYNKCIPAQFNEDLNHGVVSCQSQEYLGSGFNLCSTCQQNQQFKVRQLSIFEPLIEENYDVEVEEYKIKLERNYQLCLECEKKVNIELDKQNQALQQKLVGTKFDQSHNADNSCDSTTNTEEMNTLHPVLRSVFVVFSFVTMVLAAILLLNSSLHLIVFNRQFPGIVLTFMFSTIKPIVFLLVTIATLSSLLCKIIIGKNRLHIVDGVDCLTWLLLLVTYSQIVPFSPVLPVILLHIVSLITSVWSLVRSRPLTNATSSTFKRLSLDKSNVSESSTAVSSVSTSRKPAEQHTAQINPPALSQLDMLNFDVCSIGPKRSGSKDSGLFSWSGSSCSVDTLSSLPKISSNNIRQRRPLISPAKLQFRTPDVSTHKFGQNCGDLSAPESLFSKSTPHQHKQLSSLFEKSTAPKTQFKSSTLSSGIQTPSLFQNLHQIKSTIPVQPTPPLSNVRDINTQLTTEKLSMFNLQQSLVRPKMFETPRYLNTPSLNTSTNVVTSNQDTSSVPCDSIPARIPQYTANQEDEIIKHDTSPEVDCNIDSTTSPEGEISSYKPTDQPGKPYKQYAVWSLIVISISIIINIGVHFTFQQYTV